MDASSSQPTLSIDVQFTAVSGSGKMFSANAATAELVQGDAPSLGHFASHQINKPKWDAWKVLPEAVKTGQTAFVLAHDGIDMYQVSQG